MPKYCLCKYKLYIYIMIGIYKITSPSKKVYIGQSVNIENRKNIYSKIKCKGQSKLYNSLKKYGFSEHKFEIICECEILELNEKERFYQELYSSIGEMGLNLKLTKSNDRKCQISEETKLKISLSNRIVNAKKRGDFDEKRDYSVVIPKYKEPKKKKKNTLIAYYKNCKVYFPHTEEYFSSIKKLYDSHTDKFSSYSMTAFIVKINSPLRKHFTYEK